MSQTFVINDPHRMCCGLSKHACKCGVPDPHTTNQDADLLMPSVPTVNVDPSNMEGPRAWGHDDSPLMPRVH